MLIKIVIIYLLIVNAAGFILMLADKMKAQKNLWRIPEIWLFAISVLGGSIGSLLGMSAFRHKTQKFHFILGMPLILAVQILIIIFISG